VTEQPSANQGDLFTLSSPLLADVRGERSMMAYPFFALSTSWKKPLAYKTETVSIEIVGTPAGVATIYDKEILLYIASLLIAKMEAGENVSQDFYFTAYDLFRVTGTNTSARSYARLADALERLQGTQIKTNIEAGGEGERGYFSWLSEARLSYIKLKNGEQRLKAVRVRLCDWLYRAILLDQAVLDYSPTYFQIGPVERRLYEVARAMCAPGPVEVDIDELRLQVGYQNTLRHFRHVLKGIAEGNVIPDYYIHMVDTPVERPKGSRGPRAASTKVTITPKVLLQAAG
jgi:plasmid replication initiation protein